MTIREQRIGGLGKAPQLSGTADRTRFLDERQQPVIAQRVEVLTDRHCGNTKVISQRRRIARTMSFQKILDEAPRAAARGILTHKEFLKFFLYNIKSRIL